MGMSRNLPISFVVLACVVALVAGCGGREARRTTDPHPPVVIGEPGPAGKDTTVIVGSEHGTVVVNEGPVAVASGHEQNGPPDHAPAHGYRRKHGQVYEYHYYPAYYAYYSPQRGLYWYMRSGRWEVSVSLPEFLKAEKDHFVSVQSEYDAPYMEFETHRAAHPNYVGDEKPKGNGKDKEKGPKGQGKGKGKGPAGPNGPDD